MSLRYTPEHYAAGEDFRAVTNAKFEGISPESLGDWPGMPPYEETVRVSSEVGLPRSLDIPRSMRGVGLFDLYRTIPGREAEEMDSVRRLGGLLTNPRLQSVLESGDQEVVCVSAEGVVMALHNIIFHAGQSRQIVTLPSVPQVRLVVGWLVSAEVVRRPPPVPGLKRPFGY